MKFATDRVPRTASGTASECILPIKNMVDSVSTPPYKEGSESVVDTAEKEFIKEADLLCEKGRCMSCDSKRRAWITASYRNRAWASLLDEQLKDKRSPCLIVCGMYHLCEVPIGLQCRTCKGDGEVPGWIWGTNPCTNCGETGYVTSFLEY